MRDAKRALIFCPTFWSEPCELQRPLWYKGGKKPAEGARLVGQRLLSRIEFVIHDILLYP